MNLDASPPLGVTGAATVICIKSPTHATAVPAFNALGEENRGTETRVREVFSALPRPFLMTDILSHIYHFVSNPQKRQKKQAQLRAPGSLLMVNGPRHKRARRQPVTFPGPDTDGRPLYAARESAFLWRRLDLN